MSISFQPIYCHPSSPQYMRHPKFPGCSSFSKRLLPVLDDLTLYLCLLMHCPMYSRSVLLLRDSARWRGGPDLSPGMSQRSGSRGGGMPIQGLALAQAPRVSPTFALLRQTDRQKDGRPPREPLCSRTDSITDVQSSRLRDTALDSLSPRP